MTSLWILGMVVLVVSYRTTSYILLSQKKSFSVIWMAPVGSKEMFNVFIDSFLEANEGDDAVHTPKKWSKSKPNNDINASELREDLENFQLSKKDSALRDSTAPTSKAEIFEIFIKSDDDCKEDECVIDTPDSWKKGTSKSTKLIDEMNEENKSQPFWLDDNDSSSDRDDTPLAWKKRKM